MRLWLHSQAVENYTAGQKCWPFDGGSGYGDTGWGSGDWGVRLALNRDGCAIGSNCRGRHIWPAMQPGLNLPHSRIQMSISVVAVVSISPRRSFIFPAPSHSQSQSNCKPPGSHRAIEGHGMPKMGRIRIWFLGQRSINLGQQLAKE